MVVLKVFYLLYQSFRTYGCLIGHLHDGVILLLRPECFFKKICDHVTPVMKDLHWLNFSTRIHYKILFLTLKLLSDLAPYHLSALLVKYHLVRSLPSCNGFLLQVSPVNTLSYGYCLFSYCAPKMPFLRNV